MAYMTDQHANISRERAANMNPVVLAFVGDAVQSLLVRRELALSSDSKTGALQKRAAQLVSAKGQAKQYAKICGLLTEEEKEIFRRARNAKKPTKSKNADVAEYNISTGFEAVLGYLYLTGAHERLRELVAAGEEDED